MRFITCIENGGDFNKCREGRGWIGRGGNIVYARKFLGQRLATLEKVLILDVTTCNGPRIGADLSKQGSSGCLQAFANYSDQVVTSILPSLDVHSTSLP